MASPSSALACARTAERIYSAYRPQRKHKKRKICLDEPSTEQPATIAERAPAGCVE
jgi:hypothetical protein